MQKIETIDMIEDQLDEEALEGFFKGIIIKYLLRYNYKKWLRRFEKSKLLLK